MKRSNLLIAPVFLAAVLGTASPILAQQSFQLSSKFHSVEFFGGKAWNGGHKFGNVFCMTFPHPAEIEFLSYAMYNNNTLFFSGARYKDTTGVFVVASTVPAGRAVEVEIGNLEAQNQESVDAYPDNFTQVRVTGLLGPSLKLTIRNSVAGPKDMPFPFARNVAMHADGKLRTLSVHRLFVRGSDRIEVAGLRYFPAPIGADSEADAIASLSALVESASDSLQLCSERLPPRAQ